MQVRGEGLSVAPSHWQIFWEGKNYFVSPHKFPEMREQLYPFNWFLSDAALGTRLLGSQETVWRNGALELAEGEGRFKAQEALV